MYLSWDEHTINDFSEKNIESMYERGYVFTRLGKGIMNQTRSIRINLDHFEPSSENKRILKKTEHIKLTLSPIPYADYQWNIHKMGKEFYEKKFGEKTFSAQKIKELITDDAKTNFNILLAYRDEHTDIGYCIAHDTQHILHYCYPFYDLQLPHPNIGMGMMLKAIMWAKENNKKYIYLGSAQRPTDTYKMQFTGLEWFDGNTWHTDIAELKSILLDDAK